jgi:hypothetical protein
MEKGELNPEFSIFHCHFSITPTWGSRSKPKGNGDFDRVKRASGPRSGPDEERPPKGIGDPPASRHFGGQALDLGIASERRLCPQQL